MDEDQLHLTHAETVDAPPVGFFRRVPSILTLLNSAGKPKIAERLPTPEEDIVESTEDCTPELLVHELVINPFSGILHSGPFTEQTNESVQEAFMREVQEQNNELVQETFMSELPDEPMQPERAPEEEVPDALLAANRARCHGRYRSIRICSGRSC